MNALVRIPDRDRRRLISTVGLLASDKVGEVFAAVQAANRQLARHDLTLPALVEQALDSAPARNLQWQEAAEAQPAQRPYSSGEIYHLVLMCQHNGDGVLNAWEINFLDSIGRERELTPKQWAKLNAIARKVGVQ